MKTYQKRIFESFNKLTEELNHKESEKEVFNSLLETVIDLAVEHGMELVEKDIEVFEAINSDEMFLTSTSLCICPVSYFNGKKIGKDIFGPVTSKLIDLYKNFVSFDFVDQYLKNLD